MNYEVKEQLYEGKAKQVFATNDPEIVMVHYKDCLLYTSRCV